MVEGSVELVDGVRSERVAYLGPVESDTYGARGAAFGHAPVIGDVGEIEALHGTPRGRVEEI